MHATPRLQQGLRESKFHGHWIPFEGQASVNQQTMLRATCRGALGSYSDDRRPMRRTAVVDHRHYL
jgi:hypothetical protein